MPSSVALSAPPVATDAPSETPLPRQTIRPDGSILVHFDASDGLHLTGRIFETGSTTIVLAHMGNSENSQDDWLVLVPRLVAKGFTVLTYNRRGVCSDDGECSGPAPIGYGNVWKDVVGAVSFAHARGAAKVIVGGASIGAMSSLYAVLAEHIEVAGLMWIAGLVNDQGYSFEAGQVAALGVPILIVSAVDDRSGAGDDAQQLYDWASEPKSLVMIPGRWHGTEVWTIDDVSAQRALEDAILDFVALYG